MPIQTRETLKSIFKNKDIITEEKLIDLIDSFVHQSEVGSGSFNDNYIGKVSKEDE
jgi:hypothetical protein